MDHKKQIADQLEKFNRFMREGIRGLDREILRRACHFTIHDTFSKNPKLCKHAGKVRMERREIEGKDPVGLFCTACGRWLD